MPAGTMGDKGLLKSTCRGSAVKRPCSQVVFWNSPIEYGGRGGPLHSGYIVRVLCYKGILLSLKMGGGGGGLSEPGVATLGIDALRVHTPVCVQTV